MSFRSHSKSAKQIEFRDWLAGYIYDTYQNVLIETDDYGNLYVTKTTDQQDYINCVIAHLDINQQTYTSNFSIVNAGQFIVGIDNNTGKQIGLGHDDKTGVYFALKALQVFPNLKCFFPLNEEIGCLGSKESNDDFFKNVGFMVQLDRRGHNEISSFTNGHDTVTYSTQLEFDPVLARYNFVWARTVSTDVGVLIQKYAIQGTNISCGYNLEHTNTEILDVLRYGTCEKFALGILKVTDGKKYYMPIKTTTNSTSNTSSTKTTQPAVVKKDSDEKKNTSTTTTGTNKKVVPVNTIVEMSPEDEIDYAIESLYEDDCQDIPALRLKIEDIFKAWSELMASWDKDVLLYRLRSVVKDINFALNEHIKIQSDKIEQEFQKMCNDYVGHNKFTNEEEMDEFFVI